MTKNDIKHCLLYNKAGAAGGAKTSIKIIIWGKASFKVDKNSFNNQTDMFQVELKLKK